MTVTCTVCGYDRNPKGAEYCDACGAELSVPTPPTPIPPDPVIDNFSTDFDPSPPIFEPSPPLDVTYPTPVAATTARLIAKQPNPPVSEFPIDGSVVIGIFDPDSGPVDIDLEDFLGNETVSRNHAEIYLENGVWKIKDLSSTNGVFIKPAGQTRFNARITAPTPLNAGDEIAIAKIRFLFQTP